MLILMGSRYRSNAELLALVRSVAEHAHSDKPTAVSKRRFDIARRSADLAHCPSASNLCRRLGMDWPEVLELAARERTFHTTGSRIRAASEREGGSNDHATRIAAIQLIATRLKVRSLRPDGYETERQMMLAGARGAHRRNLELRLPTVGQFAGENWDEMLQAAGLDPRVRAQITPSASSLTDITEWFLIAQGYLPGVRSLHRFGREYGIAIPHVRHGDLARARDGLRERRAQAGLWTPPRLPTAGRRGLPWSAPDQQPDPVIPPSATPRLTEYRTWTNERVMTGLILAVQRLGPEERLNQPMLRKLAKTHADIPSASVVSVIAAQHGTTFAALRDEAVAVVSRTN